MDDADSVQVVALEILELEVKLETVVSELVFVSGTDVSALELAEALGSRDIKIDVLSDNASDRVDQFERFD